MDADPLDVLRKAMRLQEAIAAREQAKGDKANLSKMGDSMQAAASLARDIAAIEDRRGITQPAAPGKLEIELVPNLRGLTDDELETMERLIRKTQAAMAEAGEPVPEETPEAKAARELVESFSERFKGLCSENDRLRQLCEHWQSEFSRVCHEREADRLAGAGGAGMARPASSLPAGGDERVAGVPAHDGAEMNSAPHPEGPGHVPTPPEPVRDPGRAPGVPGGPPPGANVVPMMPPKEETLAERKARLEAHYGARPVDSGVGAYYGGLVSDAQPEHRFSNKILGP